MTIRTSALLPLLVALCLPAAAFAKPTPPVVAAVYKCRAVTDSTARLRCYDEAAAALEQAEGARTLTFGDEDDFPRYEGPGLETTIMAARVNRESRWIFTLPDGSRWLQTDTVQLPLTPKAGMKFKLKVTLMKNYRARVGGATIQVRQIG